MHTVNVPLWLWAAAIAAIALAVTADLLVGARRGREPGLREAALSTAAVVALGALFGMALGAAAGPRASGQFFAGWLTEYSLSLDNLFVFVLLIGGSGLAPERRGRVLLLGTGFALLLRGVFIVIGAAALSRFSDLLYLFGGLLLVTSGRLALGSGSGSPDPSSRLLRAAGRAGRRPGGRALLAVAGAVAVTDLVFAMDSIPAIFGLTRDPFIILAANAFALLGLRHLYVLISSLIERLVHLSLGLSAILGFIGVKLLFEALEQSGVHRIGPVPLPQIGTGESLAVIGGVLAAVTISSLVSTWRRQQAPAGRDEPDDSAHPARPHGPQDRVRHAGRLRYYERVRQARAEKLAPR